MVLVAVEHCYDVRKAARIMGLQRDSERISVIIPVLNEESNIQGAIANTQASQPAAEIIVVEGKWRFSHKDGSPY